MTSSSAPVPPDGVRHIAERRVDVAISFCAHSDWSADVGWLAHGVTGRAVDMSLFGGTRAGEVLPRWTALRDALRFPAMVHARQVHGAEILVHGEVPAGILIASDADGHATTRAGTLLAVSVADCVPVYLVAPDRRAIALLHGGWRGVAAGIVERGIELLARDAAADVACMRVHCGPAICGDCYEVGEEVPSRLGLRPDLRYVDLRAVIAQRAVACGVAPSRVSLSTHCTRCGPPDFYSHRGGCAERQIALLGMRE